MKLNISLFKITIVVILAITTIVSSNLNWGRDNWKGIIEADGKGYYAYLPATFIYNDFNYGFFQKIENEKYFDENFYYDYRHGAHGQVINKYYCGTAVAELPFFFVAHFASYMLGYETDGYSKLYPILINLAALFYLFVGLLYLNSSLKTYAINEWQRCLILFAAVFGTHLFYYAVGEPGMSHIYSFAFISMFLFYARQYFSAFHKKYILFLALSLGMITLIRPINGIIIFALPFAAGNFSTLKTGVTLLFRDKLWLFYSVFGFFAILSIQFIIYKISTGSFFVYSYGDEGFNFLSPHFFDILFSYKKGLFLYTPLLFLALIGGYFLWKSSRFAFFAWFGFFILLTYIFSSWWMWYYGGSFSSRVYVEFIPLFMILLALALKKIKPRLLNRLFITMIGLLIVVCQIQTYQYRYFEIHWSDMTKEKYWDVFLRVDKLMK